MVDKQKAEKEVLKTSICRETQADAKLEPLTIAFIIMTVREPLRNEILILLTRGETFKLRFDFDHITLLQSA